MSLTKLAKWYLNREGYAVRNLWQAVDVQQNHECSQEEALDILNDALDSESVAHDIFEAIDREVDDRS